MVLNVYFLKEIYNLVTVLSSETSGKNKSYTDTEISYKYLYSFSLPLFMYLPIFVSLCSSALKKLLII